MIFTLEQPLRFKLLGQVTLEEVYGMYGVYVLWHGRAKMRPTYIGQGDIIQRFNEHVHKPEYSYPIKGYMALIGGLHYTSNKKEAELTEAILLDSAELIDKFPSANRKYGKNSLIERTLRKYNMIRIYAEGYNPFIHPDYMVKWKERKLIELKSEDDGWYYSIFPWKSKHKTTSTLKLL